MIAYFNGSWVDHDSIAVSPEDRGFLFADGVYEVIRAYGGRPFAVAEHAARLARSLSAIQVAWPARALLPDLIGRLLAENDLAASDALIYVQITRGAAPRKHRFPPAQTPPTAYAVARAWSPTPDLAGGVAAILAPDTRWARCDIKSIGLLPNVLAHQQAVEAGAAEAIFVRDGVVTEGTRTNVCAVRDGEVHTHPLDNHVLPGVTLAEVARLCRALRIPWRERAVTPAELVEADEVLLLGTTMEVTPVVQLDDCPVGHGGPGPVAAALLAALRRRVGG